MDEWTNEYVVDLWIDGWMVVRYVDGWKDEWIDNG